MKKKKDKIVVVGSGAFATSVANLLAGNNPEHQVMIYADDSSIVRQINSTHMNSIFLPEIKLHDNVEASSSVEDALVDASDVFIAVPADRFEVMAERVLPYARTAGIVIMTKGLAVLSSRVELYHNYLKKRFRIADDRMCAVSGPSHSLELSIAMHTVLVAASVDPARCAAVAAMLRNNYVSVRETSDICGVLLGGALKNPVSIALGFISRIPSCGDNMAGVLVSRAFSEIIAIAKKAGCSDSTLFEVSGLGDLVACGLSEKNSSRQFGKRLSSLFDKKGKRYSSFSNLLGDIGIRSKAKDVSSGELKEAGDQTSRVLRYAASLQVDVPFFRGINELLSGNYDVDDFISSVKDGTVKKQRGLVERIGTSLNKLVSFISAKLHSISAFLGSLKRSDHTEN